MPDDPNPLAQREGADSTFPSRSGNNDNHVFPGGNAVGQGQLIQTLQQRESRYYFVSDTELMTLEVRLADQTTSAAGTFFGAVVSFAVVWITQRHLGPYGSAFIHVATVISAIALVVFGSQARRESDLRASIIGEIRKNPVKGPAELVANPTKKWWRSPIEILFPWLLP